MIISEIFTIDYYSYVKNRFKIWLNTQLTRYILKVRIQFLNFNKSFYFKPKLKAIFIIQNLVETLNNVMSAYVQYQHLFYINNE